MIMSRTRRLQFQRRLRWLSRTARRERSLSRCARLNRYWQTPRHHQPDRREVNRDHGRRVVVAAAEVVVEVARGRQLLQPRLQSPENRPPLEHPRQKRPKQKHPPRNRWLWGRRRLKLRRLRRAPARERWFWRSGCRDRARVRGSSGTTFIRFRATCCANFYSMTRRSSAFRIWSFPTCDRC